jgi:hypothetical protein
MVQLLKEHNMDVIFSSPTRQNHVSETLNRLQQVPVHHVPLGSTKLTELVRETKPHAVIFDRFVTEDQFGWKAREVSAFLLKGRRRTKS